MKKKAFTMIPLLILLGASLSAAPAAALPGSWEKTVEDEFDVKKDGIVDIDVDTGGDIYVESWGSDKVGVRVLIGGRDWENVEVDLDRTRKGLKVDVYLDRKFRRNKVKTEIWVKVPEEFDVHFSTLGGDVEVSGVKGEITGKTMGGDMEFRRLEGLLEATTMGGDILVSDSRLDGKVKTFGGDVRIEGVTGDLRGSTFGGDVTYDGVEKGPGRSKRGRVDEEDDEVSISTLGGDLDLDYEGKEVHAKTFGGDIDVVRARKVKVMTMGGDIDVDEAPEGADMHTMGGDITVDSAGGFVKAKTMGGNIDIKEIDGWVKATTMGGDVKVRMTGDPGEGKRDIELSSMGGDIELHVPDGLSMKFDVEISYTRDHRGKCRIESDFPIEIRETDEWKRKWGQKRKYIYGTGEYNGGEHIVKIRTINGDVLIKKD